MRGAHPAAAPMCLGVRLADQGHDNMCSTCTLGGTTRPAEEAAHAGACVLVDQTTKVCTWSVDMIEFLLLLLESVDCSPGRCADGLRGPPFWDTAPSKTSFLGWTASKCSGCIAFFEGFVLLDVSKATSTPRAVSMSNFSYAHRMSYIIRKQANKLYRPNMIVYLAHLHFLIKQCSKIVSDKCVLSISFALYEHISD